MDSKATMSASERLRNQSVLTLRVTGGRWKSLGDLNPSTGVAAIEQEIKDIRHICVITRLQLLLSVLMVRLNEIAANRAEGRTPQ